jgi:hypothetical protein
MLASRPARTGGQVLQLRKREAEPGSDLESVAVGHDLKLSTFLFPLPANLHYVTPHGRH